MIVDWALRYTGLGWKVFPVNSKKKPLTKNGLLDATDDEATIRSWWTMHPKAGIGVATGSASGIVVLDIDLKEGSSDSVEKIIREQGVFTQTVLSRTGGGGYHVFFGHPGDIRVPNAQNLFGYPGVDVRGDGGYVVVPPSRHESGFEYQWEDGKSPFDARPGECPSFLYQDTGQGQRRGRTAQEIFTAEIGEGERNATLTSIAGLLRTLGLPHEPLLVVLRQVNQDRCHPPLPDAEVETIAHHIMQYPPRNNRSDRDDRVGLQELLGFEWTDTGFGMMIAHAHLGRVKFDHTRGIWLIWREHYWQVDDTAEILLKAIETAHLFKEAAALITDDELREAADKYARSIQSRARLESGLIISRSLPTVATTHEVWNREPSIVAASNCVVDLKTGSSRPGLPEDYMSAHVPVAYNPDAKCPTFMKFLDDIFAGDKRVIDFVQRAIGYSITGETSEQVMFMLVGRGANGKSTLLDVLHNIFGRYSYSAPFTTFERTSNPSQQSNDIAVLAGRRLVTSSEPNEGVTLSESRIKALTGGEIISARFLHQEFFEFRPAFKIWLGVNHLPRVLDDSDGFWRRVRRIDFPIQFVDKNPGENQLLKDPDIGKKLAEEVEGIFAWIVQGAVKWYASGLHTPKSVEISTQTYRMDSDPLYDFFTACCIRGDNEEVITDDLYRAYVQYCKNRFLKQYEIMGRTKFVSRLDRELPRGSAGGRKTYLSISLDPSAHKLYEDTSIQINMPRIQ